jgi:hypothetical protein
MAVNVQIVDFWAYVSEEHATSMFGVEMSGPRIWSMYITWLLHQVITASDHLDYGSSIFLPNISIHLKSCMIKRRSLGQYSSLADSGHGV